MVLTAACGKVVQVSDRKATPRVLKYSAADPIIDAWPIRPGGQVHLAPRESTAGTNAASSGTAARSVGDSARKTDQGPKS